MKPVKLSELYVDAGKWSFSFPPRERAEETSHSLVRFGVMRPVLVIETGGGVELVAGCARVAHCRAHGIDEIWARVVDGSDATGLWELLLEDQLAEGAMNIVEVGLYISKRLAETGESLADGAKGFFQRLGLSPKEGAAREPLWVAGLELAHQRRFVEGELPEAGLRLLTEAPRADALTILNVTAGMTLGRNKFIETARWAMEGAWREKLDVAAWLKANDLNDIAEGETFRKAIWRLRFPQLSRWTDEFAADVTSLKLPGNVSISHSKGFEGGKLRLTTSFESVDELRETLEDIAESAEAGDLSPLEKYLG